ncbi:hypothetical protein ASD02_16965 [Ensifer sp. Root1252]|nr:hypothetical protein ASD00_20160 [Ensifer sp. Root31]KQW34910.1 hypothetical protein ASD02_16965 [Ensifer sp. Root1252]KRC57234.1 hypothetical protein ASE32_20280 [Ensifer sp. Root231]KRC87729.1 hypothetical protein ASE47_14435 [Ensifer sp. Root258]
MKRIVIKKSLLHRVQSIRSAEAFDRPYISPIQRYGELKAGIYAFTINQDRACAALSMIAALLSARKLERTAQQIQQRNPWGDFDVCCLAVDHE